jgi:hypothetical protein
MFVCCSSGYVSDRLCLSIDERAQLAMPSAMAVCKDTCSGWVPLRGIFDSSHVKILLSV